MFEHFTFGAQPQFPSQEEDTASPTDISSSISAPPSSFPFQLDPRQPGVGDIVQQMSESSLSRDGEMSQRPLYQITNNPIMDVDDNDEEDLFSPELSFWSTTRGMTTVQASYTAPPVPIQPPSTNRTVACRRLQRQRITQNQSSSNHVRDIAALVEEMIESRSECTLRKTPSKCLQIPPPSGGNDDELVADPTIPITYFDRDISPDEDEGFAEMEDYGTELIREEISLRQKQISSKTPSGIRKHTKGGTVSYRRSAECVETAVVHGKLMVRSAPRVRKRRRVKTVDEQG